MEYREVCGPATNYKTTFIQIDMSILLVRFSCWLQAKTNIFQITLTIQLAAVIKEYVSCAS